MKIFLKTIIIIYLAYSNWSSYKKIKKGNKLDAIYDALLCITTFLFIILMYLLG